MHCVNNIHFNTMMYFILLYQVESDTIRTSNVEIDT